MALLKERIGIEIVDRVTGAAPIDRQLTFLRGAKDRRVYHKVAAMRAHQTLWVEVLQNPLGAFGQAE
jgi:hypothetical protein